MNEAASTKTILQELGSRISSRRLALNLTQGEVAEQAGLGLRTVQRLESGAAATRLSSFIQVCRVLGLLEALNDFLPEPKPGPMELLRQQGRRRQRASGRRSSDKTEDSWTWDENP